jgi:hypothetical protein
MIDFKKKLVFSIISILIFCLGITVNEILVNNNDEDILSKWLLLISLIISIYILSKLIFQKK